MKKTVKYTDGEIGDIKVMKDFLPPPQELAFKEDQVKVTIGLEQSQKRCSRFEQVGRLRYVPQPSRLP